NFEATYNFGLWTYAFGKAENSFNHRAILGFDGVITRRLTMHVADEFVRADDPGFLSRIGVVAPQIGIFDNILDLTLGYRFTRRFYGSIGYRNHFAFFDSFSAAQVAAGATPLFDGTEHDGELALGYRVTRRDDFRASGRVQLFGAGPQHSSI